MTSEWPKYNRVLVACPGGVTTAGPEALHQLVAALQDAGQPAAVVYHPFDRTFTCPPDYAQHAAPVARFEDRAGDLVVFPEILPMEALAVRRAHAAVWWMSVNNFTFETYAHPWRDRLRYFRYALRGRRPWRGPAALRGLRHFAQSHYALAFLREHGLQGELLSDPIPVYTEPAYLAGLPARIAAARRVPRVLYNPRKGMAVTRRVMAHCPQVEFQPLVGLDRTALAEAFLSAQLYIDFGQHPGKDRLPREAALHGCCVITSRKGSAGCALDVNIPERFRIEDRADDFLAQFDARLDEIRSDFARVQAEFQPYRETIAAEPARFAAQIRSAFATGAPVTQDALRA